jgi:nitroreductase
LGAESYAAAAARTWRLGTLHGLDGTALLSELVRYATLAPSSHNTQCWKFGFEGSARKGEQQHRRAALAAD